MRFALTIFLSAFLLFIVQLILGKFILPWFGGTPAVWTACVFFFQAVLLLGHAYAHAVNTRLVTEQQGWPPVACGVGCRIGRVTCIFYYLRHLQRFQYCDLRGQSVFWGWRSIHVSDNEQHFIKHGRATGLQSATSPHYPPSRGHPEWRGEGQASQADFPMHPRT